MFTIDREIYLVQNLQEAILRHRLILHNAANCCAEIDCYLSLAEAARKYEYKKPIISEDDVKSFTKFIDIYLDYRYPQR